MAQTVILPHTRKRFSSQTGLAIHTVNQQNHLMTSSDGDFLRKRVAWLMQTAAKTTRLIQKTFQIIKYRLPSDLIPRQLLQNCHQYQGMKVKWKRMFLMTLMVMMKWTIKKLWGMTSVVKIAGYSIFSICDFHFNVMYIAQYCIRYFCF